MNLKFENMNPTQQRLHNAAIVIRAEGGEDGFASLQLEAVTEIERLRAALSNLKEAVEYTPLGLRGLKAVELARIALEPVP